MVLLSGLRLESELGDGAGASLVGWGSGDGVGGVIGAGDGEGSTLGATVGVAVGVGLAVAVGVALLSPDSDSPASHSRGSGDLEAQAAGLACFSFSACAGADKLAKPRHAMSATESVFAPALNTRPPSPNPVLKPVWGLD